MNKKIDIDVTAYQIGPRHHHASAATPGRDVTHPECFGRFTVVALSLNAAIRNACAASPKCAPTARPRTARPAGGTGVKVTTGVRKIIVNGTAKASAGRDRAIPAHPHRRGEGHHPATPHHHRHPAGKRLPASATIEEKVKESQQTVENKPFPANPPRRERLRESKSPHLSAEARIVQQASIAPAKGRG